MENIEKQNLEKTQESIKLFERLTEKIRSENPSIARKTALNLSWLQEDGLEILKNALIGDEPHVTKAAAAYGLRKMQGRMKKIARKLLEDGCNMPDDETKKVCENAIRVINQPPKPIAKQSQNHEKKNTPKIPIREIPTKRIKRTVRSIRDNSM
ncbi:MAG: hypothetical protein ACYSWP_25610 [Planctomycetota bacterium]